MARFTIRVELHNATWQNYVDLAKHMATNGMVDIIQADNGARYKMPPAEYSYDGPATRDQVLQTAKACAARVVSSSGVLVTESAGRSWDGLKAA